MADYSNFTPSSKSSSIYHSLNLIFKKVETVIFIFLSITLIFTSQTERKFSNKLSNFFIEVSAPVSKFIALPFNITSNLAKNFKELTIAREQNKHLKEELRKLKIFYINALYINSENKRLQEITNYVGHKNLKYKTAKIIGRSNQTFKKGILINAGDNENLKTGSLVIGKSGVIGRLENIYSTKSSIIAINDVRSHIPVISNDSRVRGILTGDNSELVEMIYLPKNHNIQIGEMVYTSGDGETLPSGFLIGKVVKIDHSSAIVETVESGTNNEIVTIISF